MANQLTEYLSDRKGIVTAQFSSEEQARWAKAAILLNGGTFMLDDTDPLIVRVRNLKSDNIAAVCRYARLVFPELSRAIKAHDGDMPELWPEAVCVNQNEYQVVVRPDPKFHDKLPAIAKALQKSGIEVVATDSEELGPYLLFKTKLGTDVMRQMEQGLLRPLKEIIAELHENRNSTPDAAVGRAVVARSFQEPVTQNIRGGSSRKPDPSSSS